MLDIRSSADVCTLQQADIIDSDGDEVETEDIVFNCMGDKGCHAAVRKRQVKSPAEQKFGKQGLFEVVFFLHRWCLQERRQSSRCFAVTYSHTCTVYSPHHVHAYGSDATKGLGIATEWLRG